MKYRVERSFEADYARLSEKEREPFRTAIRRMNEAHAEHGADLHRWPKSLRIKRFRAEPGVWEMTWSFTGPDGRALFDLIQIDGEPAIRWLRIGTHRIFEEP